MHRPLAEDLAARGNRVITLDLLGHGRSDRPRDMWRYSMAIYGEQVVGLMDHLGIEQAVVMGTSLGANAALEVASRQPERLRGLVIEMPVLDNGLLGERARVHAAARGAHLRRAGDEAARARHPRGAARGCCPTTAT